MTTMAFSVSSSCRRRSASTSFSSRAIARHGWRAFASVLRWIAGVLADDRDCDQQICRHAQQIEPGSRSSGRWHQSDRRRVQRQQPKRRRKCQEQKVAAAPPESKEEQPAGKVSQPSPCPTGSVTTGIAHYASQMKPNSSTLTASSAVITRRMVRSFSGSSRISTASTRLLSASSAKQIALQTSSLVRPRR